MSWAIPAELFGTAMRLKGVSFGAMTSFAFNTMIGQVTPIALTSLGWKFYILFIVVSPTDAPFASAPTDFATSKCNIGNAIFFWCFLPETKGLNLEDM